MLGYAARSSLTGRHGRIGGYFGPIFFFAICSLMISVGCGAPEKMSNDSSLPAFFNQTNVQSDVLMDEWTRAQQHLAEHPIYINAATSDPPKYLPADPRALQIIPCGVYVIPVPDAPFANLPSTVQAVVKGNPTGVFFDSDCLCYVYGNVSLGSRPHVYVAASRAATSPIYEFENIILYQLGYDVSQR
jgi:hypothetical protein